MSKGVKTSWGRLAYVFPVLAVVACGGDDPQTPTTLTGPSSTAVTGIVGSAVSTIPTVTVKDQKGKALANIWVKWTASAGKPANDSSKTDAAGSATSGGWTLGTVSGNQTLTASSAGLGSVSFTADAKAGAVRSLAPVTTTVGGPVNSDVATPPSVKALDQYGNTVAGVAVTFAVATGAGSITGPLQTTNASGIATVGSWKLGTLSGMQTLRADNVESGSFTTISTIATNAAASELVLVDAGQATGSTGKRLCTSPVVSVRDAFGNGVGGVTVTFTPAANSGGVVTGGQNISAANTGFATLASWNLGATGTQTLVATSTALPGKQLTFTATLVPEAGFTICPRFIGTGTARQRLAVTRAVERWQQVIVGHTASGHITTGAGDCVGGIPALNEDIEDLILYVNLTAIDGPKNIVGQAGPCYIWTGKLLTSLGYLELDVADLDLLEGQGMLDNTVLHEIGHILGIGTLWNYRTRALLVGSVGSGGTDPYFIGAAAREQFALVPNSYGGTPVPVENCVGIPGCGQGTRDGHWRKSLFNTELMQGYVAPTMPLSRITVGSLADLGYSVNLAAADAYLFNTSLRADDSAPTGLLLKDDIADLPLWTMEKNGTRTLVRQARNPFKQR